MLMTMGDWVAGAPTLGVRTPLAWLKMLLFCASNLSLCVESVTYDPPGSQTPSPSSSLRVCEPTVSDYMLSQPNSTSTGVGARLNNG